MTKLLGSAFVLLVVVASVLLPDMVCAKRKKNKVPKTSSTTTHSSDEEEVAAVTHFKYVTPSRRGPPAFAVDLYRNVARTVDPSKNIAISPLSAEASLTMAYRGANANTARELSDVLKTASKSEEDFYDKIDSIRNSSSPRSGFTALSADGVFIDQSYEATDANIPPSDSSNGQMTYVDFTGNAEQCRNDINNIVKRATNNRILELLQPGSLSEDTKIVLVNALYFKADWEKEFDKAATANRAFTLTTGEQITVPLMSQKNKFLYTESRELDGAQLLEIPYKNHAASMIVILPAPGSSLRAFENSLSSSSLNTALARMVQQEVLVSLPKFKMEASYSLVEPLKAMGIVEAFTGDADFPRFSSAQGLKISEIVQKVFMEVDEKGTEAAAATGVHMTLLSSQPDDTVEFKVDRPFLYLIRHNPSNSILFFGRITDPSASSD